MVPAELSRVTALGLIVVALAGCGQSTISHGGLAGTPSASPQATSGGAPLDDQWVVAVSPSIASPSHPVVWFRDPSDDHRLVAYDWDGSFAGAVTVRATEPFGVTPSPDGARIVLLHARPLTGATLVGRARGDVTWARDDEHLCAFRTASGEVYVPRLTPATPPAPTNEFIGTAAGGVLYLDDPATQASRSIERFGSFGDHGGPEVLACSVPDDRAVVGESFVGSLSDVHAVSFSGGRRTDSQGFAGSPQRGPDGIVSSRDARFIGVGSTAATWSATPTCHIRSVDTGATLATVDGGCVGFSDDDSRMLAITYVGNSNQRAVYRLLDWRSGHTLWSEELSPCAVFFRPHAGDALLLPSEWRPVPGSNRNQLAPVAPILVRGDGSVVTLPLRVLAIT